MSETFSPFGLPAGVAGFRLPQVEVTDPALIEEARKVLDDLAEAITAYKIGGPSRAIALDHLDPRNAEVVSQVLGEGEVSIVLENGIRVQESVMAGIWRVATLEGQYVEVADIPAVVRTAVAAHARLAPVLPESLPQGAMNVLPVLVEIGDAASKVAPGRKPHEIVLTLLPMTPVDLEVLGDALGMGGVSILSRGYGNCRIQSLGVRHVWRINYFNSDDKMILDTIEIGDVPASATASQEDIDDGLDRLKRIMEAYF